jgi:hypothetical protein
MNTIKSNKRKAKKLAIEKKGQHFISKTSEGGAEKNLRYFLRYMQIGEREGGEENE